MNAFGFIWLMRTIFSKHLPDLNAIQKRGLLAVKIAQHFALRVDFLDEQVCLHLSKLFGQADPIPSKDFDQRLETLVSKDWLQNFEKFDKTPFAAASVGQTHFAALKDDTEVVVKILKSNYAKELTKDVASIRRLLKVSLLFAPILKKVFDPVAILDYIEDYTLTELDLQNEIKGIERLQEIVTNNNERYDLSLLKFPKFFPELSSVNVLVTERIRGETFDRLLEENRLHYKELLDLFNLHGFYLFGVGVFHGDLHPGNIILGEDGYIYLIDSAAVSTVKDQVRKGLFEFFVALCDYDYSRCADWLNYMADAKITGKRLKKFELKMQRLYQDFRGATVSEVSLTKKMMDTIKLGIRHGMEFDHSMFAVIKSMMYLDGMVLRCNPDAKLIEDMKPYIDSFKEIM